MAMQSQENSGKNATRGLFSGFMHDFELSIVMELLETQDID